MILFKNRPFMALLIINIIYLTSVVDFYKLAQQSKSSIKTFLGNMGIKKYKSSVALESKNLVIYFNMEKSLKIDELIQKNDNTQSFLNDVIVHRPATYNWGSEVYNLNREGYYYLIDFKKGISRNIVIYENNIVSLLSSLSWLTVHGSKDDATSFNSKYEKLLGDKLSLTCGDISSFASSLLNRFNIENRIVNFVTLDEKNSYDNGHVLIEVKINSNYILFDLDNNQYFKRDEEYLNAKDFIGGVAWGEIELIKLSTDNNTDTQNFHLDKISLHGFVDYINNDIKSWYKRVMQVPMITKNGQLYMGLVDTKLKNDLFQYYPNAMLLTKDAFNKKFYGE